MGPSSCDFTLVRQYCAVFDAHTPIKSLVGVGSMIMEHLAVYIVDVEAYQQWPGQRRFDVSQALLRWIWDSNMDNVSSRRRLKGLGAPSRISCMSKHIDRLWPTVISCEPGDTQECFISPSFCHLKF